MKKMIDIACTGAGTLAIHLMTPIQDELKVLTPEKLQLLKNEIIEDGFSFPIAIWENPENAQLCILDGTQRHRALTSLKEDGWLIPEIPIVMVEADSLGKAKHKLLAAASQYGKISDDGVMVFLTNIDVDYDKFVKNLSLDVKMDNILEHVFSEPTKDFVVDVVSHKRNLTTDAPTLYQELKAGNIYRLGDHQFVCGEDLKSAKKLLQYWDKISDYEATLLKSAPKVILREH